MSEVSKVWNLDPETEYRFELDPGSSLAIKLVRGQAEIFGAELVQGKPYLFGSECKAAIFTWKGCTLEAFGQPSTEYVSDETPMSAYGNLHIALEQMRVRAHAKIDGTSPNPSERADPPKVLVVGPENSGKTTVCKILTNYAVRAGQGWCPILINTDPSEGGWGAPGVLGAAPITSTIPTYSPANPFGSAASTAPNTLSSLALVPISYWYGHPEIKWNPMLMERLIRNLGFNVNDKFDNDPEGTVAGLIVDTPSSFAAAPAAFNDQRQKLIKSCVEAFGINLILIVGHEKLNVEMQRTYGSQIPIVKIPKSGGVVELDIGYRERVQKYQLHAYMYGQAIPEPAGVKGAFLGGEVSSDLILSPSSTVIAFGDLTIYRIGAESMAPSSALPIGAARVLSELQQIPIDPSSPGSGLLNAVLAILSPFHTDENERYDEEILDLTVEGFIIITNLDIHNKKMTILSPNFSSVVGKTAVVGSFEWQDQ